MYDSALKVAVFLKLKTAYLKVVFVNIINDKLKGVRDFCCCFILVFFFSYSAKNKTIRPHYGSSYYSIRVSLSITYFICLEMSMFLVHLMFMEKKIRNNMN
jgi:hypothetical protein